jgi:hypothetical protein
VYSKSGVPDDSHVRGPIAGTQTREVVTEHDVQHPVQPVLDPPVAAAKVSTSSGVEHKSNLFSRSIVLLRSVSLSTMPMVTRPGKPNSSGWRRAENS